MPVNKYQNKRTVSIQSKFALDYYISQFCRIVHINQGFKTFRLKKIMKPLFLYSKQTFPMNLEKINATTYYSLQNDAFYRMQIMPTCTVFVAEDVQENQFITLTKYDPIFLMIQMLFTKKYVQFDTLPHYLQKRNWNLISTVTKLNQKVEYTFNKEKTFDYLQKKVKFMEDYFFLKNPLDRLNFVKNEEKNISQDTISLLKNQINPDLISQFVKQRYQVSQNRKMAPQIEENEALKPKPSKSKKQTPVTKPAQLPKNQPTLWNSFKKK